MPRRKKNLDVAALTFLQKDKGVQKLKSCQENGSSDGQRDLSKKLKKRKQNKLIETMECVGNRGPNEVEEQMWLGGGGCQRETEGLKVELRG